MNGRTQYDFALIELYEDVETSDEIAPVCLPEDPDSDFIGAKVVASGWGPFQLGGTPTEKLHYVPMTALDNGNCGDHEFIQDYHLCATGKSTAND